MRPARSRRRFRRGRRPGRRRRRPRRHAARAHRRPDRDRGRDDHPGRHRPLPARRARAELEPRRRPTSARSRWSRPARWPTPPRRWHRGEVTLALAAGGQRGPRSASRPGAAARRPGSSTASTPSTARCSRPRPPPSRRVETAALVEAVKRVALVAERNTPVRLAFTDGQVVLEAGSGDDAQASEALPRRRRRRRHLDRVQPAVPARRLGAIDAPFVQLSFTAVDQAGGAHRARPRWRPTRSTTTATCSCRSGCPADSRRASSTRREAMELGLVGLGKMGGNMRERLRAPATRRRLRPQPRASPTSASLAELVEQAAPPRGRSG